MDTEEGSSSFLGLQEDKYLSNKTKSSIQSLAREMQKKWHQMKRSEKCFFESFPKWVYVFLAFEETEQKQVFPKY